VNDADGPAFLERELMGLGVDGYQLVKVNNRVSGPVSIYSYTFREHLTCFSNVKCITFLWSWYTRLDDFTVSKGGDGISQVGLRASE
jgi:hypothetical protein